MKAGGASPAPTRAVEPAVDGASRIINAMTIDVEDYFHVSVFDGLVPRHRWEEMESRVVANTERLLEIFNESGIRATFFVLGWVAERFPQIVRSIAAEGHEIASHGYAHRLVYDLTPRQFREDIKRSKGVIQDATSSPVMGYRAPSYSITPRSLWALDVLIEEGFLYDSSIFPIHHDRYGIPISPRHPYVLQRAGALVEAPGSTVRWGTMNLPVGGGGYFRILPYGWTRWGIGRLTTVEKLPAIFYLHPWEIDPDQPRLGAGVLGRFRHYYNLGRTEERLRNLIRDFSFSTMAALLDEQLHAVRADNSAGPLPYIW